MRVDAAIAASATGRLSGWGAFAIASTAVLLVANDSTMLFAAFGALRHAFPGATAAELSWVLNAYTVVFATLLVPAGGLADRFGTRPTFLVGLALFLGGSAAAGLSPGLGVLVASRVVQGVGAALVTPSSLAIILAAFPPARRAVVVGLWGAASALGAAIGPIAGSFAARSGHRVLLVTGSLVFAAAGTWLLLVPGTQAAYLGQWLPAMLLSGIGIGMVLPSLSGAAVAGLAPARFAVGGAVNQAIRQFGAVLGVALTVRWLGGAELAPADFGPVFGMQIALALLTGLLCLAVHTRPGMAPER